MNEIKTFLDDMQDRKTVTLRFPKGTPCMGSVVLVDDINLVSLNASAAEKEACVRAMQTAPACLLALIGATLPPSIIADMSIALMELAMTKKAFHDR